MNFLFSLLQCLLFYSLAASAQDRRFRTYGNTTINRYTFPHRAGGGSVESCITAKTPKEIKDNCGVDFFTLGQINDRQRGPYAGMKDPAVFKRWGFLRDTRPQRWDCRKDLGLSVTNWFSTSRCYDQIGTDKYEELLRNQGIFSLLPDLGVIRGQEYKRDILQAVHDSEKDLIRKLIENYLSTGVSDTIVFEIGNEPNIYPAMSPETYGWYLKMYADTVKKVATEVRVQQKKVFNVRIMTAGLWIFDGMPISLVDALDQGIHLSFGILSIPVPVGFDYCGVWPFRYPCGIRWHGIELNEGMDIKSKFYTDVRSYWDKLLTTAGKGTIDIANLHFYPYVAAGARMTMQQHLEMLKTLSAHVAAGVTTHDVWLTEIGNFNPYNDVDTRDKVMIPMLTGLKANAVPQASRWYWFKGTGDDKKFESLPTGGVSGLEAGGLAMLFEVIQWVTAPGSPLRAIVAVKKPDLDPQRMADLLKLFGRFGQTNPTQGLYESANTMAAGKPRQIGITYHKFASNSTYFASKLRKRYQRRRLEGVIEV